MLPCQGDEDEVLGELDSILAELEGVGEVASLPSVPTLEPRQEEAEEDPEQELELQLPEVPGGEPKKAASKSQRVAVEAS